MTGTGACVIGVGMTPFRKQPEVAPELLARSAARAAIADAGVPLNGIQAAFVGTVWGESGSGQRILKDIGLVGIPIVNVENMCASGSSAFLMATTWIQAGRCDVALVLGVESMSRSISGPIQLDPSDVIGAAGVTAPSVYALLARWHMDTYGTTIEQIASVTVQSRRNASHNERAIFQNPLSLEEVLDSRLVADPIRLYMACPNADGAAAAVVVSERVARQYTARPIRVLAGGLRAGRTGDRLSIPGSIATQLAAEVYEQAGVGPEDVDVAEVHDAFAPAEIVAIERLGFCRPGEGGPFIMSGRGAIEGGEVSINPSGGYLSRGHPAGATGVAQIAELTWQLRGEAGGRQVANARIGVAHSQGGNVLELETNACAIHVLAR